MLWGRQRHQHPGWSYGWHWNAMWTSQWMVIYKKKLEFRRCFNFWRRRSPTFYGFHVHVVLHQPSKSSTCWLRKDVKRSARKCWSRRNLWAMASASWRNKYNLVEKFSRMACQQQGLGLHEHPNLLGPHLPEADSLWSSHRRMCLRLEGARWPQAECKRTPSTRRLYEEAVEDKSDQFSVVESAENLPRRPWTRPVWRWTTHQDVSLLSWCDVPQGGSSGEVRPWKPSSTRDTGALQLPWLCHGRYTCGRQSRLPQGLHQGRTTTMGDQLAEAPQEAGTSFTTSFYPNATWSRCNHPHDHTGEQSSLHGLRGIPDGKPSTSWLHPGDGRTSLGSCPTGQFRIFLWHGDLPLPAARGRGIWLLRAELPLQASDSGKPQPIYCGDLTWHFEVLDPVLRLRAEVQAGQRRWTPRPRSGAMGRHPWRGVWVRACGSPWTDWQGGICHWKAEEQTSSSSTRRRRWSSGCCLVYGGCTQLHGPTRWLLTHPVGLRQGLHWCWSTTWWTWSTLLEFPQHRREVPEDRWHARKGQDQVQRAHGPGE